MNVKSLALAAAMATAVVSPLVFTAYAKAQEIEFTPRGPRFELGEGRHEGHWRREGWRHEHHHHWDWRRAHHHHYDEDYE